MNKYLQQHWKNAKAFRVILIIVIAFAVLRLVAQGIYLATLLAPGQGANSELPDWTEAEGPMVPADLQIYMDAAKHFQQRQDLYLKGSLERLEDHYPYGPPFALLFTPFLWLTPGAVVTVHTLMHIVAYGLLYLWWGRIFERLNLTKANEMLARTLPVWIVFSAFWGDLGYLNIYIMMAFLGTLLIEAILNENLGGAVLWLTIIIHIKPHWAFAAAVPLLLGRRRFFFKLISLSLVAYFAIAGATILISGPSYGIQQYRDYIEFLGRLSRDFPWRGPDKPFLGYNHSIKQIVFYLLGVSTTTKRLATGLKILLLIPLGVVSVKHLIYPVNRPGHNAPELALDLTFALYLGAFIWLDMVWELSLGIAVFTYLLATHTRSHTRGLLWIIFLPYALVDAIQLLSYAILGMSVMAPGPYILTDPSIYIPLVMIVILTFYTLLIKRLWIPKTTRFAQG